MGANSLLKENNIFEKYIKKHFIKYIVVLVIYLLGFLMGIAIFNKNIETEENLREITTVITSKIEMIGTSCSETVASFIKQDYLELVILFILSFSVIGIPVIMIFLFMQAISLGITISALIYTCGTSTGLSFSLLVFLIPSIIKVIMVLLILCSSIKFAENIFKYKKEVKYELIRHGVTNLLALMAIITISMYRTFSLNIVSKILF